MGRTRLLLSLLVVALTATICSTGWAFLLDPFWEIDAQRWEPFAECTGVTPGGTVIAGVSYVGPCDWDIIDVLTWQFGGDTIFGGTTRPDEYRPEDERWSFLPGGALSGTLYIDWYEALDYPSGSSCVHGAAFACDYVKGPTDPENLEWIQVVRSSTEWEGLSPGTMYGDPFPSDGPGGTTEDRPYYYYTGEDRTWLWGELGADIPPDADLIFSDRSRRSHIEAQAWSGWWRADLYLASWDSADPYNVFIYDGIEWGWDGECVPEFPPALLALIGMVGVLLKRRR